jgi:hypothetical protein
MNAIKLDIKITNSGNLQIDKLPFNSGDEIEVILWKKQNTHRRKAYPFKGMPVYYLNPTAPVAETEWEVIQ